MCESGNLLNVFIWLIHRNSIEFKFEIIHSISHIQLKIIVPLTFSVVFPNNNSSHKTWNPFSFVMINLNCESLFFFIVFNNAEASVCKPNLLKIMSIEFFLYGGFFFQDCFPYALLFSFLGLKKKDSELRRGRVLYTPFNVSFTNSKEALTQIYCNFTFFKTSVLIWTHSFAKKKWRKYGLLKV